MTSPHRKLGRRLNNTDHFEYIKPLTHDDLDKDALLFYEDNHDYRPEYLELPIKIESDMRLKTPKRARRLPESSESSQNVANEALFEEVDLKSPLNESFKEQVKDEYDELMDPINRVDFIDSLLMPFSQGHHSAGHLEHHQNFLNYHESEIKEEGGSPKYETFEMVAQKTHLEVLQDDKKNLLTLVNNFRAFTQATNMVVHFHKFAKKDTLSRVYANVLNVLNKESRKLDNQLQLEQTHINELIEAEKRKELQKSSAKKKKKNLDKSKQEDKGESFDTNKELFNTSIGGNHRLNIGDFHEKSEPSKHHKKHNE